MVKAAGAAVVAALVLCARAAGAQTATAKAPADVYLDKCAVCHGPDGAGKTAKGKKLKVKDVRETSEKLTSAQMIEIVTKGKVPDMGGFGKELTADMVKQLVEYYRGLAKSVPSKK